jgi:hypothetical protein
MGFRVGLGGIPDLNNMVYRIDKRLFFPLYFPNHSETWKETLWGDGPVQKMHHFFNVSTIDGGEE